MDLFIKAAAAALITAVIGLVFVNQNKDMTILLTLAACTMIAAVGFLYLKPAIEFFHKLTSISNLDEELLGIILKTVGIGLIGELSGLICSDAGNAALGKALQMLTTAVVLWLSIPLFENLLALIEVILGEI